MDKLTTYCHNTKDILTAYANLPTGNDSIKREVLFDTKHDRYQLLIIGWQGHKRFHSTIIHVDIIGEQIWIQYDMIETGIANDFVALGVPKEDIVLVFHAPYKRKYMGYGDGIST